MARSDRTSVNPVRHHFPTKFVKGFPVRAWYKEQGIRNEALDRRRLRDVRASFANRTLGSFRALRAHAKTSAGR
jgi:hypothetical protein